MYGGTALREQEARFESAAKWTKEALLQLDKGLEFDAREMESFRREWFKREACPWSLIRLSDGFDCTH